MTVGKGLVFHRKPPFAMADVDDAVVCGWVYLLFVGGATHEPQSFCFLLQRHNRTAVARTRCQP